MNWLGKFAHFRSSVAIDPRMMMARERSVARKGNFDAAVDRYLASLWRLADQRVDVEYGRPRLTAGLLSQARQNPPAEAAMRIEAASVLAEDLVNLDTDFSTSKRVLEHKNRLQEEWRAAYGRSRLLYLGEDWTRNFGHLCMIQYLIKLKEMDLVDWDRIVVVSRAEHVANSALLRHFEGVLSVETDPRNVVELAPRVSGEGLRVFDLISWRRRRPMFLGDALNIIESLWAERKRRPVLSLSPAQVATGQEKMEAAGLPSGATFVCIHVRESGYHNDGNNTLRNSDIAEYLPATKEVVSRGDWVVRLGDPSMSKLPAMDRFIDYAHWNGRTPELDVYLGAQCRFFLGTNSGPKLLPTCFGRPVLATNYTYVFGGPPLGRESRFLPKLIARGRRTLTFRQMMQYDTMKATYTERSFKRLGYKYLNNTSFEIAQAVVEMYDRKGLTVLQQRYVELAPVEHQAGNAIIGAHFVEAHANLL